MATAPRQRFGIAQDPKDYTVFDLGCEYEINSEDFFSKGRSTPFEGVKVYGRCAMTVCGGLAVWQELTTEY